MKTGESMKLMAYWRPWMMWGFPALLALVGFLVGCFRGDSQLIGRSVVVMMVTTSLGRFATGGDIFS